MTNLYKEKIRLLEEQNKALKSSNWILVDSIEPNIASLTERIEKGESEASKEIPAGAEEIFFKYMNKLPAEYVNYIPQRERDRYKYIIEAMKEYASIRVKEALKQ